MEISHWMLEFSLEKTVLTPEQLPALLSSSRLDSFNKVITGSGWQE